MLTLNMDGCMKEDSVVSSTQYPGNLRIAVNKFFVPRNLEFVGIYKHGCYFPYLRFVIILTPSLGRSTLSHTVHHHHSLCRLGIQQLPFPSPCSWC